MSVVAEVKDTIIDAKKKYDKEKYISVLEEQIEKLQLEIERMNTKISMLEKNKFTLNSDHLELFKVFKDNNYHYYLEDISEYAKKDINLEIALSELMDKEYFKKPSIMAVGSKMNLSIPEDKKLEFLQALKQSINNH